MSAVPLSTGGGGAPASQVKQSLVYRTNAEVSAPKSNAPIWGLMIAGLPGLGVGLLIAHHKAAKHLAANGDAPAAPHQRLHDERLRHTPESRAPQRDEETAPPEEEAPQAQAPTEGGLDIS